MVAIPLAPLPLMIKIGVGAMSAVGISLVLIAGGLFFLFKPDQRMFVSVVTAIASLTSMATTNLGGFGVGMMAGLIGSSMAFGWMPDPVRETDGDDGDRLPGPSGTGQGDPAPAEPAEAAPGATGMPREGGAPKDQEVSAPKAREDRARSGSRRRPARSPALIVVSALVSAAGLPATAAAAPGTDVFPLPWPTLTRPWDSAPSPSPLPPLTGRYRLRVGSSRCGRIAAGHRRHGRGQRRFAGPGRQPGDGTGQPGRGRPGHAPVSHGRRHRGAPQPRPGTGGGQARRDLRRPGRPDRAAPAGRRRRPAGAPRSTYPISPDYPEVGADTLTAYGAIIHGATYLPTADGGRMKVLWVHADRLIADNYTFRLESAGQVRTIDVDLDIPQVDIYVTQLTGSITIPVLGVATPRICVGADIVPANLPVAVQLPKLSVTAVEAGQVLVDAETVNFTDLSVHSKDR